MRTKKTKISQVKKTMDKVIHHEFFTYFWGIFTLFFVTETLNHPESPILLFLKSLFNCFLIKILLLCVAIFIGYYNPTLGVLLVINFFFLININDHTEFFSNILPNLIDKNKILKYEKNFKNKLKPTPEEEEKKKKKKEKKAEEKEEDDKPIEKSKKIKNPIQIEASKKYHQDEEISEDKIKEVENNIEEEVEEIDKKIRNNDIDTEDLMTEEDDDELERKKKKLYLKYYQKKKKLDKIYKGEEKLDLADPEDDSVEKQESLQKFEKKLKKQQKNKMNLIQELKETELEQEEEDRLKRSSDKTMESEIKSKKLDQRRRLRILEDDEDSDSSSSDSSDSSSSSESSSDSEKEYEDISMTEAREHVLKKLRNRMKKEYYKTK